MMRTWQAFLENIVLLTFLSPLVGACLVVALSSLSTAAIRRTVLINGLLTLSLALLMVTNYDPNQRTDAGKPKLVQMRTSLRWLQEKPRSTPVSPGEEQKGNNAETTARRLQAPDVRLAVGVDGLSLWFLLLASLLAVPALLAGRGADRDQPAAFYALLLATESSLLGIFAATDVVLFAICLGILPILLFFLIGRWGGYERRRVITKVFVYNLAGSLLILYGLTALVMTDAAIRSNTQVPHPAPRFDMHELVAQFPSLVLRNEEALRYWNDVGGSIFLALLVGFAIRGGLFPLHSWVPAANAEAPGSVSVLLPGVVLATSGYGFLRFVIPIFPQFLRSAIELPWGTRIPLTEICTTLAVVGVLYMALLSLAQDDLKKMFTYASLSQMALCAVGFSSLNQLGITGGILQLLGMSLSAAAALFLVATLEMRYCTRDMAAFGGLKHGAPLWAGSLLFASLAVIGVPVTAGFVAQLLAILGIFQGQPDASGHPVAGLFVLVGLVLLGWAIVRMLDRLLSGPLRIPATAARFQLEHMDRSQGRSTRLGDRSETQPDLTALEQAALLPCFLCIVWLGIWPQFFISRMEPTVSQLMSRYAAASPENPHARKPDLKPPSAQGFTRTGTITNPDWRKSNGLTASRGNSK